MTGLQSPALREVAQLVEHQLPKLRVASSSLVSRFGESPGDRGGRGSDLRRPPQRADIAIRTTRDNDPPR